MYCNRRVEMRISHTSSDAAVASLYTWGARCGPRSIARSRYARLPRHKNSHRTYRRVRFFFAQVVMSDGATFRVPSAVRLVSKTLQLERDPANHPVYLGSSDQSALLSRREEARLERLQRRSRTFVFEEEE